MSPVYLLIDWTLGLGLSVIRKELCIYVYNLLRSLKRVKLDKATLATLEHEYLELRGSFLRNISKVTSTHCKVLEGESLSRFSNFGTNPSSHSLSNTVCSPSIETLVILYPISVMVTILKMTTEHQAFSVLQQGIHLSETKEPSLQLGQTPGAESST